MAIRKTKIDKGVQYKTLIKNHVKTEPNYAQYSIEEKQKTYIKSINGKRFMFGKYSIK